MNQTVNILGIIFSIFAIVSMVMIFDFNRANSGIAFALFITALPVATLTAFFMQFIKER